MNSRYIYSKDDKVTVCIKVVRGETFRGIARRNDTDGKNAELGKQLAEARCELNIHKYNLENIRDAKNQAEIWADFTRAKIYNRWYQDACKAEKACLKHIKVLKNKIKHLCNGDL